MLIQQNNGVWMAVLWTLAPLVSIFGMLGKKKEKPNKMLIQLPAEVWMDVLDWLRGHRREFAAKCDQLGDRRFSQICQCWLHEHTKNVQLGCLRMESLKQFDKDARVEEVAVLNTLAADQDGSCSPIRVPFAEFPMPENINSIFEIDLKYLDAKVLTFIRKMLAQIPDENRHLCLCLGIENRKNRPERSRAELDAFVTTLGHLVPLFNGISGIQFGTLTSLDLLAPMLDQFPEQVLAAKYINICCWAKNNESCQLKLNLFSNSESFQALVRWLCTPQASDAQRHRWLSLFEAGIYTWYNFYGAIYEDFMAATAAKSLSVAFDLFDHQPAYIELEVEPSRIENVITGEQLVVVHEEDKHRWSIIRCPSAVDGIQWLNAAREEEEKVISDRLVDKQIMLEIHINSPKIDLMEGREKKKMLLQVS